MMNKNAMELNDEAMDKVTGGYDYTLAHMDSTLDRIGRPISMTCTIVNRQTGKAEVYSGGTVSELFRNINEANKSAGETTVRLFNGKTGKLAEINGQKLQWRVE